MMDIADLNHLSSQEFHDLMFKVCGSRRWLQLMAHSRPFTDQDELEDRATSTWQRLTEDDWLEAFAHHPKIGDTESLRKRFASTAEWAKGEQAGVGEADEAVLEELRNYNEDYEQRFGFIFIVCATGLTATEMLDQLKERYGNTRSEELPIAVNEAGKIILLRLAKL